MVMADSDYVWPHTEVWPSWSAWSTLTTLPDVVAERTLSVSAAHRTLVVEQDN